MNELLEIVQLLEKYESDSYRPYLAINSDGDVYLTFEDKYGETRNRFYSKTLLGHVNQPLGLRNAIQEEVDAINAANQQKEKSNLEKAKQTGLAKLSELERKALGLK